MNQQQNQSQGGQSQRQGSQSGDPSRQQEQGLPDKVGQGDHLIDEDDGIPGSGQDAGAPRGRQQEQSDSNRAQQDAPSRTGSDSEQI